MPRHFAFGSLLPEPHVTALPEHLALPIPAWSRRSGGQDNWEATPWKDLSTGPEPPKHF